MVETIDIAIIFKRTKELPLFHPYFINYMGNKLHYYTVLNTMSIMK